MTMTNWYFQAGSPTGCSGSASKPRQVDRKGVVTSPSALSSPTQGITDTNSAPASMMQHLLLIQFHSK